MRMRKTFVAVIACATASAAFAQAKDAALPDPLTLDEAVRIALQTQNQIGIARSQKDAAAARLQQTQSAYFPQITPTYQYSDRHTTLGSATETAADIALQQTVFDSGRREVTVARSRDALRSAELNVRDARQGVVLSVTSAWYELLRAKELVRVAESGVERAKATLDATQAFVEAGTSPRKDVLQAKADYDNAQVTAIQARNSVRLAQTTLKNAIGIITSQPINTPEAATPQPSTAPDPKSIDDYVAQAYAARPDLQRSLSDIRSTKRSVTLARINAGPQLESTYTAAYEGHPNVGQSHTFLTTVSYPLFDGGASRAAVREAQASVRQAEQQLELTRQDVAASVESAYLQREEARTRVAAAQTALAASQENYAAATESQKEGVGTILDVITARNQLVTSETNAVQAVYDFYTADARLQRAVGANDPVSTGGKAS